MSALSRGSVVPVRVARVVDGDTVRVRRTGFWSWLLPRDDIVVRLYAIDAPESDQRYGSNSTRALSRMLPRRINLEVMDVDRYGRTVGLLYDKGRGRERSFNLRLVEEGWAFAYTRYGGSDLGFRDAERTAAKDRVGMWADSRIRAGKDRPWDHRNAQRAAQRRTVRWKVALVVGVAGIAVVVAAYFWSRIAG